MKPLLNLINVEIIIREENLKKYKFKLINKRII